MAAAMERAGGGSRRRTSGRGGSRVPHGREAEAGGSWCRAAFTRQRARKLLSLKAAVRLAPVWLAVGFLGSQKQPTAPVKQGLYLLRKHGYRVSSDVFTRFKDEDGNFSTNNLMDILRLHNAAHLRTNGEIILDEAVLFTRRRLEEMLPYQEESLAYEIKCTLDIPLPRRVSIYESKDYISAYEKDDTMHERVLQLAKLNFNIMQSHHQQELKIVTRWWQDIQIESRLPFARDRVVECYLWALGVYFEPCYSRGRIILAMMNALCTLFDDIYDSYATSEECEIFTKCVESWNTKYVHDLPDCMKFALGKILDSFQAIEHLLEKDEKYRMPYLKSLAVDLVRGYNVEAKMRDKHYVPKSVEEHLQLSMTTIACHVLSCASLVGIDHEKATKDSFDWVSSKPKMVQALCIILRLLDDLQSYEREQLTPHVASTIDSYIKEHNVSIEEAREKIQELKEKTWIDMNTGWLDPDNGQPKHIRERVFNLTRTMEFFYSHGENFTYCDNLKDTIYSLLVEPFTTTTIEMFFSNAPILDQRRLTSAATSDVPPFPAASENAFSEAAGKASRL